MRKKSATLLLLVLLIALPASGAFALGLVNGDFSSSMYLHISLMYIYSRYHRTSHQPRKKLAARIPLIWSSRIVKNL